MPEVDGVAAAALMSSWRTNDPGYCLRYVWNAYAAQGATSDKTYPTALSAWNASQLQVPGDRTPPLGFPVYLGAKSSSQAGDVMISLGGGLCIATDWPRNGVIGQCTIDQRQAQTGRPYLGWAQDILGNPILGIPPEPVPTEGDDMAKTTGLWWNRARDGAAVFALHNPGSGFWSTWEGADGAYNSRMAVGYDTGDFVPISESHASNLEQSSADVRAGAAGKG